MTPEQQEDLIDLVAYVKGESFLELSVMDLDFQDDTLLALINPNAPKAFVEMMLKKQWDGPIEVYCANDFITGSAAA